MTGALLSTSAFAQQQPTKHKDSQNCVNSKMAPDYALPESYPAAYNAPAGVKINGGWDLSIDASFIYWYVSQEYMDIAKTATYAASGATPAAKAKVIGQHFNYEPGFKVGFEFNTRKDEWMVRADYLWMHFNESSSFGAVPAAVSTGIQDYIPNDYFGNYSAAAQQQAVKMTSYWKMNMDMVDLSMSRPFYQGRHLIVSPYGGLRGLFIRQTYNLTATNAAYLTAQPGTSSNRMQSWAVGPNTGACARYVIGEGFRFEGKMGFSLLYTRYTKLSHSENNQFASTGILPINGSLAPQSTVRPAADMGLGFGWGTYFAKNDYHVDFSASYDFSVFWNQNMMRQTTAALANNNTGYASPAGDLMMQGLTVNASLDF